VVLLLNVPSTKEAEGGYLFLHRHIYIYIYIYTKQYTFL